MAEDKIPDWRQKQMDLMLECVIDAHTVMDKYYDHVGIEYDQYGMYAQDEHRDTRCGFLAYLDVEAKIATEFYRQRIGEVIAHATAKSKA